jgi:hypothetical protein
MSTGVRCLLVVACFAAATFGAAARAQPPAPPPAPVPVQPPGSALPPPGSTIPPPVLGQPVPQSAAPGATLPPVPPLPMAPVVAPPPAPVPAPAVVPDAGRDGWANIGLPSKPEGLFVDVEFDILKPSVKNQLSAPAAFPNGTMTPVSVPQSSIDWTAAPRFELGYHLPDGLGDLLVGYNFLVSDGRDNQDALFGPASIKSRLDINQFDLDYATATYSPLPRYDLKFRLGARLAAVYLDSTATGPFEIQQASNYYVGAGPAATLDFERRFKEVPDLGLYLRLDGTALTGQARQKYRADVLASDMDAYFEQQKTQTAEVLTIQAGFIYHPFGIGNDRLRFSGGYEYQHWWGIGKINGTDAEISAQGIFLRGEYDF